MRERIKEILKSRKIRISKLARDANLPYTTVNDIINGNTNELNVGVYNMLRIANALGVSVEFLFGYDENKSEENNSDLSDQDIELLRIFKSLCCKGQTLLLAHAYNLEEKFKKEHTEK